KAMRGRIVVAADRRVAILAFRTRPRLIGKPAVGRIDDDAARRRRERPRAWTAGFETVVRSAVVRFEQPVQIRFAVGRATYRSRRFPRLRLLHWRTKRRCRCWRIRSRIPRARLQFEVAVGFFFFRLAVILEHALHALLPIERHADLPGPGEDLWILDRRLV